MSISGSGCRPTIASALYGDAVAIVNMARLVGNATLADEFGRWVEVCRGIVLDQHWNNATHSFATIPLQAKGNGDYTGDYNGERGGGGGGSSERQGGDAKIDGKVTNNGGGKGSDSGSGRGVGGGAGTGVGVGVGGSGGARGRTERWGEGPTPTVHGGPNPACNLTQVRTTNQTVAVRELLGFMPWYFSGLVPIDAADKYVITEKSGNIFRVSIFLDFVWLTTRTEGPHGGASYVRGAGRNRIDRHGGGIERIAGTVCSGVSSSMLTAWRVRGACAPRSAGTRATTTAGPTATAGTGPPGRALTRRVSKKSGNIFRAGILS